MLDFSRSFSSCTQYFFPSLPQYIRYLIVFGKKIFFGPDGQVSDEAWWWVLALVEIQIRGLFLHFVTL